MKKLSELPVILCYGAVFMIGLGSTVTGLMTPYWKETLNLSTSLLGSLYVIQTITSVSLGILIGKLADRFKKGPLLAFSILLYILGFVFFGRARSIIHVILGLLCLGPGGNGIVITGAAYLVKLGGTKSSTYLATFNFFFSVAAILSPLIVQAIGFGQLYLLSFLIIGLGLILIVLFLKSSKTEILQEPNTASDADTNQKAGIRILMRSSIVWILGFATFAYTGIEGGLIAWMPYYFTEAGKSLALHSSSFWLKPSLWTSLFYFFFAIGRFIYTKTAQNIDPRRFVRTSGLLLLVPALIWILRGESNLLILPVALLGLLCAGIYPALQISFSKLYPNAMGVSGVWMMLAGTVGNIFWPALTGNGLQIIGINFLPIIVLVQSALMFVMMLFLRPKK